jgi:hypothetical protein
MGLSFGQAMPTLLALADKVTNRSLEMDEVIE